MTFNNLVPDPLPVETTYVPRVFGFRVHKTELPSGAANPADTKSAKTINGESPAPLKAECSDPSDSVVRAAKRKGREEGNGNAPAFLLESTKRRRKNNASSNPND